MRRKFIFLTLGLLTLTQGLLVSAQFTPQELAEREKWEEFLKTAEILRFEEIGEGVNKPLCLYLKKGDIEQKGCWKNPEGLQKGHLEGWRFEIAAYEMDKILGLNMVPPTVERVFNRERGSLQLWCEFEHSLLEIVEQDIPIPIKGPEAILINKSKYLSRAFDSLIANEDRTQQNLYYMKDWRMILIDHSRSFRSSEKHNKQLIYGKNGLKEKKLFRQLPRVFVEKIKALDYATIEKAVGPYLTELEIKAILARKKILLDEIADMIKEKGEKKVLY